MSFTRRVETVALLRLICTDTRPLHPAAFVMPLGKISFPRVRNTYGARRSRVGDTLALSVPLRLTTFSGGSAGGPTPGGGGGGTVMPGPGVAHPEGPVESST